MRHPRMTIGVIAVALAALVGVLVIATGNSNSTAAAGKSASGPVTVPGDTATLHTTTATVQGTTETILVDAHGMPLYIYTPDTTVTSHVTGQLAALWPPLVAATPTARGVTGRVSSAATTNGKQVAYNGHFLYTFVDDSPGRVTGQGVQNFFVATPSLGGGAAISTGSATPKSGYGY